MVNIYDVTRTTNENTFLKLNKNDLCFAYVLNGRNIQMGNIYTFNLETKNNKLTIRKYNIIRSARLVIIKLVV